MSEQSGEYLVPVEQAVVPFFDRTIVAARLSDGRIVAALRSLCDALQLDRYGQVQRIRGDEVLNEQLLHVEIVTEGGPQIVDALSAWAIPMWLTGVKLTRIAAEKRPAILAFKRQAADVLYRHFADRTALPAPDTLVPSEPIARPERPADGAERSAWIEYHHAMEAWLRWQDDMDRWRARVDQRQTELEDRMESVEEVTRLIPEILDRLGPETLSPEHQATVKNLAKRLNELAGFSYATIYGELNAAFHVGKYSDIPAARWPDVLAWFKARIDAAERRHAR
ncbi:MAG TPA: phage antirepressor N-terminal domain-containing protein [Ktedonobacterales bacterium]